MCEHKKITCYRQWQRIHFECKDCGYVYQLKDDQIIKSKKETKAIKKAWLRNGDQINLTAQVFKGELR